MFAVGKLNADAKLSLAETQETFQNRNNHGS